MRAAGQSHGHGAGTQAEPTAASGTDEGVCGGVISHPGHREHSETPPSIWNRAEEARGRGGKEQLQRVQVKARENHKKPKKANAI